MSNYLDQDGLILYDTRIKHVIDKKISNAKPIIETATISSSSWTTLSNKAPFTYQTTITLNTIIGANSIVELFNTDAVLFATYCISIGALTQSNNTYTITLYSIGQPSGASNTFTFGIGG